MNMQDIRFDIKNFEGKKIVVFGDMMIDEYLDGDVSRISPEAPVPVVHVQKCTKRLGGAGNVVRNLKALGADVSAVSYIGDDEAGSWLAERFESYDVDISGLLKSSQTVTSIKTRVTAHNQQLLRYDRELVKNVPDSYAEFLSDNLEKILHNACAVIISDYGKGVVTADTAKAVISAARKKGVPVIVDPKGNDYTKYSGATVCTPNMKELQGAVGRNLSTEEEIKQAGVELCRKCGIDYILATRSEKGMSLIDGKSGEKKDYPALAKEVSDVTGAGDTVISVFTLCYALGASHDDCCQLANIAASIVVSKFGAAVASPDEIRRCISLSEKSSSHICSPDEVGAIAERLRNLGKKIVFTNGCFDIVHAGHISSFKQARSFGDVLFVGVNSDASVRRLKGDKRPIVSQENRMALLESLSCIDYLVMFDDDTPESLIRAIKPDVLVKGKDWEGKEVAGGDFVRSCGGEVRFIELEPGLSTTNLINKVLTVYKEN